MCRCDKPAWVGSRPGIGLSAVSQCAGCKDLFFGYPEEAEAVCRMWQAFFRALGELGITNHGAQNQLWGRYGHDVRRGAISLDRKALEALVPQFKREMASIKMACA